MAEERTAVVEQVIDHGADTRSLILRVPGGVTFQPGQFLSCLLPVGGARLTRPYSIASDPEEPERLELLLNLVPDGPGSHHLFGLAPGDTIRFTGPWGTFVLDRAPDAEVVFIAIDVGIAPVRPMVRRALATGSHPITLVYASTHPIYRDELASLPGLHFETVDPAALEAEITRRYLEADGNRARHFFVCGVGDPVRRLRDALRGGGYARRAVQYERW